MFSPTLFLRGCLCKHIEYFRVWKRVDSTADVIIYAFAMSLLLAVL